MKNKSRTKESTPEELVNKGKFESEVYREAKGKMEDEKKVLLSEWRKTISLK
jgi:hypothetical protein